MTDGVRLVLKKNKLRKKLDALAPGVEAQMSKDMAAGAEEIAEQARAFAPKAEVQPYRRPGEYRFKIRSDKVDATARATRGVFAWGVFAPWYWLFLEFGTSRGVKAQPHMLPAYRMLKRRVQSRISRGIGKAIKKVSRR